MEKGIIAFSFYREKNQNRLGKIGAGLPVRFPRLEEV
jgi:hypothetical protein